MRHHADNTQKSGTHTNLSQTERDGEFSRQPNSPPLIWLLASGKSPDCKEDHEFDGVTPLGPLFRLCILAHHSDCKFMASW